MQEDPKSLETLLYLVVISPSTLPYHQGRPLLPSPPGLQYLL